MAYEYELLVLNLTFDPCFKVKWDHHTNDLISLLLLLLWLENVKLTYRPANFLMSVKSGF